MSLDNIVIVGAGPAGTRAAECLVSHGLRPTVISEAPHNGGQIYRRQPAGFNREGRKLYGSEWRKALAVHAAFDRIRSSITYLPDTSVFNIVDDTLYLDTGGGIRRLTFGSLLIATGAMDRVLPLPGWTLPGVYTLGGAQVALKYQACTVGRRVAFAGTGPLLYLVAYQYARAGARVAGVFDTSPLSGKIAALPWLLGSPRTAALGAYYMTWLKLRRIPVVQGISPVEIHGQTRVDRFTYRNAAGETHAVSCDAVAMGYGLKPESQLAELAGCSLQADVTQRLWTVSHDGRGRVRPGLYVAGDCSSIGGADVAELQGELAALCLLEDIGVAETSARMPGLARKLRRLRGFRTGLERAFPFPHHLVRALPKETVACRCEAVTLREMDEAIELLGPEEPNRLKAFCRTGMGRCQGRVCGPFLMEYLAAARGKPWTEIAPLRSQAPVKPLAFAKAAGAAEPGHALETRRP